jgi:hypothetical protein
MPLLVLPIGRRTNTLTQHAGQLDADAAAPRRLESRRRHSGARACHPEVGNRDARGRRPRPGGGREATRAYPGGGGNAELADQRLHYVETGEGPPIVLLHGFPEFWYGWRLQLKPLAAAGFRVVAPDCAATTCHHGRPVSRPTTPARWPPTSAVWSKNAGPSPRCWSGTTGAAPSPGPPRCTTPRSWTGWPSSTRPTHESSRRDCTTRASSASPGTSSASPPGAARKRRARQPPAFLAELSGRRRPGVHAGGDRTLPPGMVPARASNRDDQLLPVLGATVAQARRSPAPPGRAQYVGAAVRTRLLERIPWPLTPAGDLGKRRCAQRRALDT